MTATASPAAKQAEVVLEIEIDQIYRSGNYRKTYDKEKLAELAQSIEQVGVLEPILVRPSGKAFDLVFGERRIRASELAGRTTIAARVKNLTDLEVLEVQLTENAQRDDVHPLEEADAYRRLHETHGKPIKEIAARVAKSEAHVRQRLKLCALGNAARAFFLSGKLSAAVANLIARIPDQKLQAQAAKQVSESHYDGEPLSFQQASEHVQRHYMLRLEQAPFDTAAEMIVPGCGPCTTCPKRTGNQRELFADVKSADVCTDVACYDKKAAAAWKVTAADAKKRGVEVVPDVEAKKLFPYPGTPGQLGFDAKQKYADLADVFHHDPKRRTLGQLLNLNVDAHLTLARDPAGSVHRFVELGKVKQLCKAAGHDFWKKEKKPAATPKQKAKQDAERKEESVLEEVHERVIADVIGKLERHEPSHGQWAFLAEVAVEVGHAGEEFYRRHGVEYDRKTANYAYQERARKEIVARLPKLSTGQLRALVLEVAVLRDLYGDFERAAKAFGADPKAIRKNLIAELAGRPKKPTTAPKPKKAAKKR